MPLIFRVRELREAAELTQADVAQAAGITISTLSRIENGLTQRVELDTLDKLCVALDATPGELFRRVKRP